MAFRQLANNAYEHYAASGRIEDLTFKVSGTLMQQLAVTLAPGERLISWASCVIAYDRAISFEEAGHNALCMAINETDDEARLVLAPGGPIGAFDLDDFGGRILIPQESLLAVGPGVMLRPYTRFRSLTGPHQPDGLVLLQAEGSGWAFCGARAEVSQLSMEPAEIMVVRAGSVAALTSTVVIDQVDRQSAAFSGEANGMLMLRGPGNVWLQWGRCMSDAPHVWTGQPRVSCIPRPQIGPPADGAARAEPQPALQ